MSLFVLLIIVVESERSCTLVASSSMAHIMPLTAAKLSCGTKTQPWILDATPGQQIEVVLRDFGSKFGDETSRLCHQYGYILEKLSNRNESICGLASERKKRIFKSSSNSIEIVLTDNYLLQGVNNIRQNYLIGFRGKKHSIHKDIINL